MSAYLGPNWMSAPSLRLSLNSSLTQLMASSVILVITSLALGESLNETIYSSKSSMCSLNTPAALPAKP